MTIDTQTIISVTEANQNFSRVTRIVDMHGRAVIFKKTDLSICWLIWITRHGLKTLRPKEAMLLHVF